jgi:hypothetical protein
VHSNEQMRASIDSGGRFLSQHCADLYVQPAERKCELIQILSNNCRLWLSAAPSVFFRKRNITAPMGNETAMIQGP